MSNKLKNKLKKRDWKIIPQNQMDKSYVVKMLFHEKPTIFFGCIGITCKYTFNSGKKNLKFIRKKNVNNKTQEKSQLKSNLDEKDESLKRYSVPVFADVQINNNRKQDPRF